MATLGSTFKTIYQWGKEIDPNGSISAVAEVLSQTNVIVDTLMFKEGNLPTGDRVTIRTGLPTPTWRLLNKGVAPTNSNSSQVDVQCGMLSDRSEVDRDLADLNGNTAQFRLNEGKSHMEGMAQEYAATMFYGSSANPEEFVGLANYYNDTSANSGENIIDAGGTGSDNASVWLVGIGDNEIYGAFPKGSKAGIMHEDMGVIDADDSDGNKFRAYGDYYQWKGCVVVKDWRYAVRIANIDISDLTGYTGTQASTASTFLIDLLSNAIDHLPSLDNVTPYFYMNRTVASRLRVQARRESNAALDVIKGVNQFGKHVKKLHFDEVPIGICDALTNAEAQVT